MTMFCIDEGIEGGGLCKTLVSGKRVGSAFFLVGFLAVGVGYACRIVVVFTSL